MRIEEATTFDELTRAIRAAGERRLTWEEAVAFHNPDDRAERQFVNAWAKRHGASYAEAEVRNWSTDRTVRAKVRELLAAEVTR